MTNIAELIKGLQNNDNKYAYQCLKQLMKDSEQSDAIYEFFDTFVQMLGNSNSYIRIRGLLLIAANVKWDEENKFDEIVDDYLKHIMDEKPITSRQCIKVLPMIAKHKPDLKQCIIMALSGANTERYNSSMQPLVYKDIQEALKQIG